MPDNTDRFPSARDIEKVARNPECETLRTALAGNVDLRKYAIEIGLQEEKQSPIALARGNQVERFLLGENAQRLVDRFVEDGKLRSDPLVVDLGRRAPNRAGLQKASEKTDTYVSQLLAGESVPLLLIHPVLSIALGNETQFIEPDAMVLFEGRSQYEPVELKSYPYRYGKTDQSDLKQARRQGAVYVYALRRRLEAVGGDGLKLPAQVTLVFTKPDSLFPAPVYSESVAGEMRDAEHAVQILASTKEGLVSQIPEGKNVRDLLPILDIHYGEGCLTFCSLAKHCRESCLSEGKVSVLGEESAKVLAAAKTVDRAGQLLAGAAPADDGEAALRQRLQELASFVGGFQVAK